MRVGFFNFGEVLWDPHFGAELDLIGEHLGRGDHVTHYVCDGELPICRVNWNHNLTQCFRCREIRRAVVRKNYPGLQTQSFVRLTRDDRRNIAQVPRDFKTIDEFMDYQFDGFEAGLSAVAGLCDIVRQEKPDLVIHREKLYAALLGGIVTFLSTQNIIRDDRLEMVYLCGGRWSWARGVYRAGLRAGIPVRVHERGSTEEKYALFFDMLSQDLEKQAMLIEDAWAAADPEERVRIASEWYQKIPQGGVCNFVSFVGEMRPGKLPDDWRDDRPSVVLFSSSTFEFSMISQDQQWGAYPHQNEGILQIANNFAVILPGHHLYIRCHPNQANSMHEVAPLLDLRLPNVTVLPPRSEVSSYALMDRVKKVLSFGSRIGAETTFWGKPSILLMNAFYDRLDVAYLARSHEQVVKLLRSDLPAKPRENALKFGYYLATFGLPYRNYQAINPFEGLYRGKSFESHLSPTKRKMWHHLRRRIPLAIMERAGRLYRSWLWWKYTSP